MTKNKRDARPSGAQKLDQFMLSASATMRDAMLKLERSGAELVCVCEEDGRLLGVLSNGDIRRATLAGGNLETSVTTIMNSEFTAVARGTPREQVLKMLDSRIKAVPIVDDEKRLVDFVAAGLRYVNPHDSEVYARARAPARLSLAGGGTDFTSYFMDHGGIGLTTTVVHHARAMLRRREDSRISIHAHDIGQHIEAGSFKELSYDGSIDLIKAGIAVMEPPFGFELHVSSDMPMSSGLGGSAALLAAVIGCFNEFREDKLDLYEIAEHAFEAERVELKMQGGWQDQYATVFGGFNSIEFSSDYNVVTPLRLRSTTLHELEERFILCHTGQTHKGEQIQRRNVSRGGKDPQRVQFAEELKGIALDMRSQLLRGDLDGVGQALGETWRLKKHFDPEVTDSKLDEIYNVAMEAGCEGGRLLGTGGGGFFLLFTKSFRRFDVIKALRERGLSTQFVQFDTAGLQSWTTRGLDDC